MVTRLISTHLPRNVVIEIDEKVENGSFINRIDAIRTLIQEALVFRALKQET